jgi:hypothetical protein
VSSIESNEKDNLIFTGPIAGMDILAGCCGYPPPFVAVAAARGSLRIRYINIPLAFAARH